MTEQTPPEAPAGGTSSGTAPSGGVEGPRPHLEQTGRTPPRTGATRGAHRAPRSRRPLLLAIAAVIALALVVAAVALLVPQDGGTSSQADPTTGPGPDAAADVAGWVDTELPAEAVLSAPDDLRPALVDAGTPEDRLVSRNADALQVVEGDPGAEAVVVARFRGNDGTLLSVVDPRPGQPTAEELDRRRRLSAAVLANPVAGASGRAAEVLRAADVDARLLGLLAVLVARLDVGIADLPRAPGQPEEGTPARRVLLDRAGGEELVPGSAAAERVRAFLAAQQPPFAPDTVEETGEGVLVGFDYLSSPDAEVTAATR